MIKKGTLKKVALISTQALALTSLISMSGCTTERPHSDKVSHATVIGTPSVTEQEGAHTPNTQSSEHCAPIP